MGEALADPQKSKVFYKYLNLPMAGGKDTLGEEIKGIEDYIPNTQYEAKNTRKPWWRTFARTGRPRAATANSCHFCNLQHPGSHPILQEVQRSRTMLKVTALFDPNIDNNGKGITKEEGLKEIVEDYTPAMDRTSAFRPLQDEKGHCGTSGAQITLPAHRAYPGKTA